MSMLQRTPSPSSPSPSLSPSSSPSTSSSSLSSPPKRKWWRRRRRASLVFPLAPDVEVELSLAVKLVPSWLADERTLARYEAIYHLSSRTPYPSTLVEALLNYHLGGWATALDVGCGAGQLTLHLSSRFSRVLAQDPDSSMLRLARAVTQLPTTELMLHNLPSPRGRIEFRSATGENPKLGLNQRVDMIAFGRSFHALDWKQGARMWHRWASMLRSGGSLVVLGTRPVLAPEEERYAPLRAFFAEFHTLPPLQHFFQAERAQRTLHPDGLYMGLPWPWDYDAEVAQEWDRASFVYTECLGERVCTTPRREVNWARSTEGYRRMLAQDTEQRLLALEDDDVLAREARRVCSAAGIDYEGAVQRHCWGALIALRRA